MIPKIEAQNLFADTKLPSFESEFVRSWLGWDESVAEDIQFYINTQTPDIAKLAGFLKSTVIEEIQSETSHSLIRMLTRFGLRRVDWLTIASTYLV